MTKWKRIFEMKRFPRWSLSAKGKTIFQCKVFEQNGKAIKLSKLKSYAVPIPSTHSVHYPEK